MEAQPFAAQDSSQSKYGSDDRGYWYPTNMKGKMMKTCNLNLTLIITVMAAMAAMTGATYAATPSHSHEVQHTASQMKHEGFGMLKAVNMEASKVQLAHEAIPSLGWPAMTMWFALRGPLPKEIKVGDRVRFELEQNQSKEWMIIRIESKH